MNRMMRLSLSILIRELLPPGLAIYSLHGLAALLEGHAAHLTNCCVLAIEKVQLLHCS